MRHTLIGLFLVGFLFLPTHSKAQSNPAPASVQQDVPNIDFHWSFGALIGSDKKFVSITHDTTLKSGEEIKMMVQLNKECFVYVVHYGSLGDVELLFPYTLSQFQSDYAVDKNYYILKGRAWSTLDENPGKEVFFIVAATERLLDLERKMTEYQNAPGDADKKPLADNVLTEIRSLRRHYTAFSTIAEKPIAIGGNIRDIKKTQETKRIDVADIAVNILAKNFYSKTITIDHK
jgi:hypothetical protein